MKPTLWLATALFGTFLVQGNLPALAETGAAAVTPAAAEAEPGVAMPEVAAPEVTAPEVTAPAALAEPAAPVSTVAVQPVPETPGLTSPAVTSPDVPAEAVAGDGATETPAEAGDKAEAPAAPSGTAADPISGLQADLASFVWQKRPVVVFADNAADPAFGDQMRALEAAWADLAARDVVVITDTDPGAMSQVRRTLRPRGFSIVVIEKDGTVAQRKPSPRNGRELARAIDKMPIRREEIRNGVGGR